MTTATEIALYAARPQDYLAADPIVNFHDPAVEGLTAILSDSCESDISFARSAFEFVRDSIHHSMDVQDRRVTVSAADVAREGVGLCYGKAHLLAAVLRSRAIPTGFCYQRLSDDNGGHVIHGLVAVYIDGAWHRQDPRGNRPGVEAEFSLDKEQLAWSVNPDIGEMDYPEVFISPHPSVIRALRAADDMLELSATGLPSEL